jgi:hypothetical protein
MVLRIHKLLLRTFHARCSPLDMIESNNLEPTRILHRKDKFRYCIKAQLLIFNNDSGYRNVLLHLQALSMTRAIFWTFSSRTIRKKLPSRIAITLCRCATNQDPKTMGGG